MRALVVPKQRQPGHAVLRLLDLGAEPEGLTLRFERRHPAERYLSENGWQKSEAWLEPERIEKVAGGLEFHIGPVVGDVLAGLTVRLAVREPGIGTVGETVVAWPNMMTSGAYDASRVSREEVVGRTVRPTPAMLPPEPAPVPPPQAAPPPPPEPAAPRLLRAEPSFDRTPRQADGPAKMLVLGAILVLVAAIAGGAWYFWPRLQPMIAGVPAAPPAAAPAPAPIEKPLRVQVTEFLAGKPSNEQILAKGREFLAAGKPDGAFLLWRAAADSGDAQASLAFAQFYDPVAPIKDSPVPPNGETAAQLYERAARGDVVEAMRRLGVLYARGHASLPADRAKARDWLKRAADKGDTLARQELDKLK